MSTRYKVRGPALPIDRTRPPDPPPSVGDSSADGNIRRLAAAAGNLNRPLEDRLLAHNSLNAAWWNRQRQKEGQP